jgi:hypothetical protein
MDKELKELVVDKICGMISEHTFDSIQYAAEALADDGMITEDEIAEIIDTLDFKLVWV